MEQQTQDETRWLARLFAIYCFLLGIRALTVLFKRISEDQSLFPMIMLSIAGSVFLFWLGYRLLVCSSIWAFFSWMPEKLPFLQYLEYRYLSLNKYIRSGLVGGIIMLLLYLSLHLVYVFNKGSWFSEIIKGLLHIILLPLKCVFDVLNFFQLPKEYSFVPVVLMFVYFFALGFGLGALISWMKGRLICSKSPQDFNNGSHLDID